MNTFNNKKRKAIAFALKEVRLAYRNAMEEVRAEIVQSVTDENDIPKIRDQFNSFTIQVAEAVKEFDLHKTENIVTASINNNPTGNMSELLSLAVETYQKGHEDEAQKMFSFASFNSNDLLTSDNLPNLPTVTNSCPACAGMLPTVSNYCPVCGVKLENYQTMNPTELQPAPEVEPKLIDQNLVQQVQKPLPTEQLSSEDRTNPLQPTYPYQNTNPSLPLPPMIARAVKTLANAGRYEEILALLGKKELSPMEQIRETKKQFGNKWLDAKLLEIKESPHGQYDKEFSVTVKTKGLSGLSFVGILDKKAYGKKPYKKGDAVKVKLYFSPGGDTLIEKIKK